MNSNGTIECIVCDHPFGDDAFMCMEIEAEVVRTCCPFCFERFNQHKSFYLAKREASQLLNNLKDKKRNREHV